MVCILFRPFRIRILSSKRARVDDHMSPFRLNELECKISKGESKVNSYNLYTGFSISPIPKTDWRAEVKKIQVMICCKMKVNS